MCSKCVREVTAGETAAAPVAAAAVAVAASILNAKSPESAPSVIQKETEISVCVPVPAEESPAVAGASGGSDAPVKKKSPKKKNRCFLKECRAKLRLVEQQTGKCLCGHTFCAKHRHVEGHDCTGDHQTAARERIAKANEKVVNDKVANRI